MFENCFDFRSEDEPPVLFVKVKRLDARSISRQHEPFPVCIPERDGIVALDIVHKVEPALFIKVQDSF